MRIKFFFFILVFFLLILAGATAYALRTQPSTYLWLLEAGIIGILLYLTVFYKKLVRPLHTIGNGMELLREQDFSSRLSPVGQYEADHIVDIFNRMMDQLKTERLRLREQNFFLDLLIQASPMGVVILTLDEEIADLNPMAQKMMDVPLEKLTGKRMNQVETPLAAELTKIPMDETAVIRLNDASIYKCAYSSFRDHGFKHPFYLMERMTEEVMRAEKRAYEKVIRMISHEVNNTTAGITSTLDTVCEALESEVSSQKSEIRRRVVEQERKNLLTTDYLTPNSLNADLCEAMRVCIERCYSMSRFITRFADVVKIPEPIMSLVPLNRIAAQCKCFMEGMCNDRNIRLSLECDPEVGEVRMDASLFEQVLVNVIKNAAEANSTEILIRTTAPSTVEVVDNGAGIPPEVEAKLFTPFFSTKPDGQGIGLVFIREVLSRHSCTFSLRTCDDNLTRFRITFTEPSQRRGIH